VRDAEIANNVYDEAIRYTGIIQRFSVDIAFKKHKFWKDLTPQLQQRLFDQVLCGLVNRFQFFFNDYNLNFHAPQLAITKIVVELSAHLIRKDELLVKKDDKVESLQFIFVGVAHLYGYKEWNGETYRLKVVTFKKGSWIGDY